METSTWEAVSGGIWGVLVAVTLLGSFAGAVWLSVHGTLGSKKHPHPLRVPKAARRRRRAEPPPAPPKVPPAGAA